MSLIPEDYLDILQSTALAYIATIGPKGEPQVSPAWFGWDGIHLLVRMTKVRQKHRNLLHDPRIAIAIADPANPCRSLEIRGEARIEEDVNYRFNAVVTKKYTGQEYTEQNPHPHLKPGEERVVIFVEPKHVVLFPPQEDKK